MAITQTMLHYLVHPWVVYSLVGLSFSILSYRENLPMTMRSCFYPLIGDRIFSWIGDFIDVVAVISTMFGVCTSLGLGAKQLNQGLAGMFSQVNCFLEIRQRNIFWEPNWNCLIFSFLLQQIDGNSVQVQLVALWTITAMSTMSGMTSTCFSVIFNL